jgi:hypothetical protein
MPATWRGGGHWIPVPRPSSLRRLRSWAGWKQRSRDRQQTGRRRVPQGTGARELRSGSSRPRNSRFRPEARCCEEVHPGRKDRIAVLDESRRTDPHDTSGESRRIVAAFHRATKRPGRSYAFRPWPSCLESWNIGGAKVDRIGIRHRLRLSERTARADRRSACRRTAATSTPSGERAGYGEHKHGRDDPTHGADYRGSGQRPAAAGCGRPARHQDQAHREIARSPATVLERNVESTVWHQLPDFRLARGDARVVRRRRLHYRKGRQAALTKARRPR